MARANTRGRRLAFCTLGDMDIPKYWFAKITFISMKTVSANMAKGKIILKFYIDEWDDSILTLKQRLMIRSILLWNLIFRKAALSLHRFPWSW